MIYLNRFDIADDDYFAIGAAKMNIYENYYPLGIFSSIGLQSIQPSEITIIYGGNGSGKSTLLNLITDCIGASRRNINEFGPLFDNVVKNSHYNFLNIPFEKKLILSDDVFDKQLDRRAANSNVSRNKQQLIEEYFTMREKHASEYYGDDEMLTRKMDVNRYTVSKYVRTRLSNKEIRQQSNGQEALDYWQQEIQEGGLYLIDEPENSLSAENQLKLKEFLIESARFFRCQFIIATHSPFILSIQDAKIYDLDSNDPQKPKKWTELENMKAYHQLFEECWEDE